MGGFYVTAVQIDNDESPRKPNPPLCPFVGYFVGHCYTIQTDNCAMRARQQDDDEVITKPLLP